MSRHEIGRQATKDYLLTLAIMVSVGCVPMLLLYKQKPEKYPSESAEEAGNQF